MFSYGLRAALASCEGLEVLGVASDGEGLVALAERVHPDVIVTDLAMPGLSGPETIRRVLVLDPRAAVLVLTMHEDDAAVYGALRAGAAGYLVKGADRDDIVRAIRAVAAGDAVYGAPVARRIADFFTGAQQRYAQQVFPDLTAREREVLDLVATGLGNHEIARRL